MFLNSWTPFKLKSLGWIALDYVSIFGKTSFPFHKNTSRKNVCLLYHLTNLHGSWKGHEAVYLFSFLLLYKISISKMFFIAIHSFDFLPFSFSIFCYPLMLIRFCLQISSIKKQNRNRSQSIMIKNNIFTTLSTEDTPRLQLRIKR